VGKWLLVTTDDLTETTDEIDGITAMRALLTPPGPPELGDAYDDMVAGLRTFLGAVAGAGMSVEQARELRDVLGTWTDRLRTQRVEEAQRLWGHWIDRPGRAQGLVPPLRDEVVEPGRLSATVVLERFYVGENMATHGGAISLLFDDVLGRVGMTAGKPGRTAYLTTSYRAVTPVETELVLRAQTDRVDGRKHFMSAQLLHGDIVCAEAECLWIELRPGQA
jgi:acyl-coenzyme A thioesterase PaaI-like protein